MWASAAVLQEKRFCTRMYLWQFRHNEAELMIREKLPESQSLIGAMH